MQIVKIFPKHKEKSHFSIRKHNGKYYVFEGDKMLREELESVNSAETEISLIVMNRRRMGLTEIPVKYSNETIVENLPVEKKKCKCCETEFVSAGKGSARKVFCSKKCSVKYHNSKRYEMPENNNNQEQKGEKANCVVCGSEYVKSRSNHLCCSAPCSTKRYVKNRRQNALSDLSIDTPEKMNETVDTEDTREGFSVGISRAYAEINSQSNISENTEFPSMEDWVGLPVIGVEDVNEFHELTEKQMRLDLRKKKVEQFATDIVDYVLTWCELNRDRPFSYHTLFNDLINYKIVDLSKSVFINVFSPALVYSEGILQVNGMFDLTDGDAIFKLKNRLISTIFEEDAIPSEEQYTKVAVIRLMTSQLRFTLYQINSIKKSQQIEDKIAPTVDKEIFDGILKMIDNLSKQNENLNKQVQLSFDMQKSVALTNTESLNNVINDVQSLSHLLQDIRNRVDLITKKRKGWFS